MQQLLKLFIVRKMWRLILWLFCLINCCDNSRSLNNNKTNLLPVNLPQKLKLIEYTSRIFCNSQVKVVNVYFENETSLSYPGQICKQLNECGVSHVAIRNKFKTSALAVLKDDGILMYLLMVIRDVSQTIKMRIIRKASASKHLTFITVVIEKSDSISDDWLKNTFKKFWNMWILNVAVICYRSNSLHIYRYDPFRPKLFDVTIREKQQHHRVLVNDVFPQQMLNMRQQPLRMCMYHDGVRSIFENDGRVLGADGLMSAYLAERLNATRIVNRVNSYGNTSISQDICFREIVDEIDDVAVNIRFLSLTSFYRRAEHTVVLRRDDLCVMVPKSQIASSFWNLFRSFSIWVWLIIFSTLLLAYGFCFLNYRQVCSRHKLLMELYACLISMPFAKLSRPLSLRVFLCVWLIYGMLISVAFKGNLTGNLVDLKYLPDVNTIKDLAKSSYLLATLPRHLKHLHRYIDYNSYYGGLLKRKMVEVPDLQFKKLIAANNLTFGYLQKNHLSVFYANSREHTCKGKPLFHVMSECIVPFHAVFIVPYGSPYLGYINTLIRNAQEFGFIIYWDRLTREAFRKSRRSIIRNRRKDDDDPVVLKLYHFQAVFFLLFVGLFLAFVCFLCEILSLSD